jgi:thiosulfate/3-mercaptopyruvate sulfurtransferase
MSRQDVLVTADWAEKNLGTDGIVFLEVDEDTTAYDGGHLPGAVKINWTTELQDARTAAPGRRRSWWRSAGC